MYWTIAKPKPISATAVRCHDIIVRSRLRRVRTQAKWLSAVTRTSNLPALGAVWESDMLNAPFADGSCLRPHEIRFAEAPQPPARRRRTGCVITATDRDSSDAPGYPIIGSRGGRGGPAPRSLPGRDL